MMRGLLVALTLSCVAAPATAQDWSWPEHPENLKELPADFPPERLRAVMLGFTRALGVGCSHCHVGEPGQPLATYDFPSDEKVQKRTAREMLRLLGSVNEHLERIDRTGEPVNMWCHTCHRGRPRPQTLAEAMLEVYRADGIEAAISEYRTLREDFYGRGAYDFSERSLNAIGYTLLADAPADAVAIFRLNAEQFPESGNVWDSLAEGYLTLGRRELARIYYRKSLEIDPTNENALEKLAEIDAGPG